MPICANHHESDAADFCTVCGIEIAPQDSAAPSVATSVTHCPSCQAERSPGGGDFCEVCGYNFRTGKCGFPLEEPAAEPPPASAGTPPALESAVEPAAPPPPPAATSPTAKLESTPAASLPAGPDPSPVTAEAAPAEAPVPDPAAAAARWEFVATVDLSVTNVAETDGPRDRDERIYPLDLPEQLLGRRSERRGIYPEISIDTDDGVSHRHAKILRQPGGGFAALDLGSSNGTLLNGVELKPNVLTPLRSGDQLCLGRWTRLTLRNIS